MARIRAAVLGATGIVGQRLVSLLAKHPWFEIGALTASERSVGKPYSEACTWRLPGSIPAGVARTTLLTTAPGVDCPLVFSALGGAIALELEDEFARAGHVVVSNASSNRMASDVPLLIPEINPDHLGLLAQQKHKRGFGNGLIVTNPNCVVTPLAMVLAPLQERWGVERVITTSLQAVSGAGMPGVASVEILDNIIPHIPGEEEKIEIEANKILGEFKDGEIKAADFAVSSQAFRVPVTDGHLLSVSIQLGQPADQKEIRAALASFVGSEDTRGLPSAPISPIHLNDLPNRPQPRLDRDREDGLAISVGRIRPCPILDLKLVVLGHNTIRGAAGAAVFNAELLHQTGYV